MAGSPQQRVAPINAGLLQSLPPWKMDDHIVEYYSLRASSPGRSGGGAGKGSTSLEFEFRLQFPCGSPSTELSDFRQSARSGNERECKQTLKNTWNHVPRVMIMTSLVMSSPPINISHGLFWCRYSNSRGVVASSSSFFLPAARAPRRACSQAGNTTNVTVNCNIVAAFTRYSFITQTLFFILQLVNGNKRTDVKYSEV